MRSSKKTCISVCLALTLLFGSFFVFGISAEEGSKVLISEVQTKGETANDEFIELYNPNGYAVSLEGWSIRRKTSTGVEEGNVLSNIGGEISAYGYLLIVPRPHCGTEKDVDCYLGSAPGDKSYSTYNYLTDNNTLFLYNEEKELVDKVGWGSASDYEGAVVDENPVSGESIHRRVLEDIMQDTDNNAADFFPSNSSPRNSSFTGGSSGTEEETGKAEDTTGEDDSSGFVNGAEQEEAKETEQEPSAPPSYPTAGSSTRILEKKVIVNELLINSEEDDGEMEFIEIYNAGRDEVDISGWSMEDKAGKVKSFTLPKGSKIAPGEYQIFYSNRTKISLNNTGDGVLLRDSAGVKISESPVSGAAQEEVAFALSEKQEWAWTTLPTPGRKNIIREIPEKTVSPEKESAEKKEINKSEKEAESEEENDFEYDFSEEVIINEVLVNPAGEDNKEGSYEWVELFNSAGRDVNLRGWCLDDVIGKGSKPFCFKEDTIIIKGGYFVVSGKESKIFFNNNSDEINLLWIDEAVVDSISYKKAREDYSYSRSVDGSWFWTKDKTPLGKNSQPKAGASGISQESSLKEEVAEWTEKEDEEIGSVFGVSNIDRGVYEFFSITEAKRLPLKSKVVLGGIVSVPPGIFGKNVFYVSGKDSGEGLQIFTYGGKLPSFRLGDEVEMFGYISEAGGEKRLVLASEDAAYKLSSDNPLQNSSFSFDNLEDCLGCLVEIEGIAENISSRIFYLNVEGEKIKVYAKQDTGISFEGIEPGNQMRISGVLSRTSSGYRILLRFSSDIRFMEDKNSVIIEKDEKIAVKGSNIFSAEKIIMLIGFLILLDWSRIKIKSGKTGRGK